MVVDLTSKAKEKLDELFPQMEENKALRIYVAGIGWGGRTFGLALEEPQDGDLKLNVDGYDFIIEEETVGDYGKFTVDYSNSFLRKGFIIRHDREGGGRC